MTLTLAVRRRLCAGNGSGAREYDVWDEDESILAADRLDDPALHKGKTVARCEKVRRNERHGTE
jgi:hypothetical protein